MEKGISPKQFSVFPCLFFAVIKEKRKKVRLRKNQPTKLVISGLLAVLLLCQFFPT
jgi:hypothetical protein